MGATSNTMSGENWIGESRHASVVKTVRHFEAKQREALEQGDTEAAARYEQWGLHSFFETQHYLTGQPKRIVSDAEAARLRAAEDEAKQAQADAERLDVLKRKLGITPRTNGSAYRPYRGGLPTLGKDR
ncbi:hypothetical protein OG458_42600 (plasmid) [Streptomyces sp. NBC_01281]|uniref:hypothetical protein n=1 Tax=Streptomyces sp. NBC_01281 TaxID=2903811 RepID=UPI002E12120C|nr:hypothetical protein OG458_42600 [Streptomyces sp. NBC_01281]